MNFCTYKTGKWSSYSHLIINTFDWGTFSNYILGNWAYSHYDIKVDPKSLFFLKKVVVLYLKCPCMSFPFSHCWLNTKYYEIKQPFLSLSSHFCLYAFHSSKSHYYYLTLQEVSIFFGLFSTALKPVFIRSGERGFPLVAWIFRKG